MKLSEFLPPEILRDLNEANEKLSKVRKYLEENIKGKDIIRNTGGKYHGRKGPINSVILTKDYDGNIVPMAIVYTYRRDGNGTVGWSHHTKSYLPVSDQEWPSKLWKDSTRGDKQ